MGLGQVSAQHNQVSEGDQEAHDLHEEDRVDFLDKVVPDILRRLADRDPDLRETPRRSACERQETVPQSG